AARARAVPCPEVQPLAPWPAPWATARLLRCCSIFRWAACVRRLISRMRWRFDLGRRRVTLPEPRCTPTAACTCNKGGPGAAAPGAPEAYRHFYHGQAFAFLNAWL